MPHWGPTADEMAEVPRRRFELNHEEKELSVWSQEPEGRLETSRPKAADPKVLDGAAEAS